MQFFQIDFRIENGRRKVKVEICTLYSFYPNTEAKKMSRYKHTRLRLLLCVSPAVFLSLNRFLRI